MVFFKFEYYLDSNNKFDRFGENKATDFEIGCINKIMLKAHPHIITNPKASKSIIIEWAPII